MPTVADFDDDEDWYDDDNEPDESGTMPCPECGLPVYEDADRCPACGYWILETDRHAMGSGGKPWWIRVVAAIVLVAMVCAALLAFF